ncbi:MAG: hypothetical protein HYR66_08485 [Sphingobacteriales bacterium]|nr:hypothetical protein [Sphingobacteriales bacterium]MBI3719132.1 hypothetical protein [Sphingobacteriales bacterium]
MKHKKIVAIGLIILSLALHVKAQQTILKPMATPITTATIAEPKVAFKAAATYVGGEPLANNTESKVNFTGAYFDEGKNFSVVNGTFVAPSDGIYHFDLRVSWLQFSANGYVQLTLRTNLYAAIPASIILQPSTTLPVFDSEFSTLLKLKTGDKIEVYLLQKSGVQQKYQQVQLSGFKVN